MHIGGGEPFLNPEGLKDVLKAAEISGVSIEYVETNGSWFTNDNEAVSVFRYLKNSGLKSVLVSISPFHNEFVPAYKTFSIIKCAGIAGLNVVPWIIDFVADLETFDKNKTNSLEEYLKRFGIDYIKSLPLRYWLHLGGRLLQTYNTIYELTDLEDILYSSSPCFELTDTSHFHIDLYGNFIPGLCTGLAFNYKLLGKNINKKNYPILNILFESGIRELLYFSMREYGFVPKDKYLSKCDLCNDLRNYLIYSGNTFLDLSPTGYYRDIVPEQLETNDKT
jgi:hypothetical protein